MRRPSLPTPDLGSLLSRRWLLVGIGNDLRGDDAFGPALARGLRAAGLPALDGGVSPESVTGRIRAVAPEVLLMADCADHGGRPGAVSLAPVRRLPGGGPSTHDPGLGLFVVYLRSTVPTLEIWLLAVQPGHLRLGEEMSREVRDSLRSLLCAFGAGEGRAPRREGV